MASVSVDKSYLKDQLRTGDRILSNITLLLSEWGTENEKFKAKLQGMVDELKQCVEHVEDATQSIMAVSKPEPPSTFLIAAKRSLTSDSSSTNNLPAKRKKSNEIKMAVNSANNQNGSIKIPKFPKPFVILSPIEVKQEKRENVIVLDSKRMGTLKYSVATGNKIESLTTDKMPLRSTRSNVQSQQSHQKTIPSKSIVVGLDAKKVDAKKTSLKTKKAAVSASQSEYERRATPHCTDENANYRKKMNK